MSVYNNFKLATLAMMTAQPVFAISVDPVQVQSAPGELLYAEMNFRQSNFNTPIEVSLATPEDLMVLGTTHQPPGHLNFFTRRSSNGTGVITITSSRPITDNDLNFVVKIKQGNATRLQHVKTSLKPKTELLQAALKANERPLTPIVVVSEKEIELNLPESTVYRAAASSKAAETPLAIKHVAPPPLLSAVTVPQTMVMDIPEIKQVQTVPPVMKTPAPAMSMVAAAAPVTPKAESQLQASVSTAAAARQPEVTAKVATPAPVAQINSDMQAQRIQNHTQKPTMTYPAFAPQAQSKDPLVKKYAEEVAAKQAAAAALLAAKKTPTHPAPHASSPVTVKSNYVVQSNESLWKIASRVAHAQHRNVNEVMQQIKQNNEHAFIGGDANRLRLGAALNLNLAPADKQAIMVKATDFPQQNKPKGSTKYRLNQAEMSLVADNKKESAQLSANQNTFDRKISKELSLKVMTAREKTVKLQKNVTDLELALNLKDQRIQLLNARLAQLQQQLKAQQVDKKAS